MTDPATVEAPGPDERGAPSSGADQDRHGRILAGLAPAASARSAVVAMDALARTTPPDVAPTYAPLESDRWTLEDDFDRGALVERIYQIVTQDQPLGTIGVYGSWGSGKSSIMRQVRRRLEEGQQGRPGYFGTVPAGTDERERERRYRGTVWFSAWEHQQDIDPAVAMLQEARRMLRPSRFNRWRMKKWFRILRNAISTAGDTLERMGPSLAVAGAPLAALRRSVEQVNRDLFDVQEDQVRKKEAFTQIVRLLARRNARGRVVFFVDDLDRCDDAVAQRLLDDIKTYLDQEQCVFVIGVNSARLRAGHDQAVPGEDRLAKIIQYPFYVPMLEKDQYRRYLERTLAAKFMAPVGADEPTRKASLEEVQVRAVAELLTETLAARSTSLREVKRLVNVFTVNHQLASHAFAETGLWGSYQPLVVAVLSAVQAFCPATFEWLSGRSDAQARMRYLFTGPAHPDEDQPHWGLLVPDRDGIPDDVLRELDGTAVLASARKIGSSLADETRLNLYLSMWGQTHQSTARQNSRWTREWRARSDLTLPEIQRWIQGFGDDGRVEHEWTDGDLRVVKLGDWWWWVLDLKEQGQPDESQPLLPRRALLLSEGLVAIRPWTGNVDENGDSDFPDHSQWTAAGSGDLPTALWSKSSLRTWLRRDFGERLPDDAKERIVEVPVRTETRWIGRRSDEVTEDGRKKVDADDPTTETIYLLKWEEIFLDGAEYAFGKMDVNARTDGGLVGFWWLRSPGNTPYRTLTVLPSLFAVPDDHTHNMWAGSRAGVRPAFWLNLES